MVSIAEEDARHWMLHSRFIPRCAATEGDRFLVAPNIAQNRPQVGLHMQHAVINDKKAARQKEFNASCVWGPFPSGLFSV